MPMLVLSPDEIYMLSILAAEPPQQFSPVRQLYLDKKEKMKDCKAEYLKIIAKYNKDGMIWFDKAKKPHLIRELEAVFRTINTPEEVLKIKRLGSTDVREQFYCKRGKMGVLYSLGKEEAFHSLLYPLKDEALSRWFAEDLLKDISFSQESFPANQIDLTAGEMLILWLLKAAIDEKIGAVTINELVSPENAKKLKVGTIFPFNEKKLFEHLDQVENITIQANGMIDKGILAKEEERYRFSSLFGSVFDPKQVQDIVIVSERGPFSRTKYLYILKKGYMLIEGIIYDPVSWKIDIIPGTVSKKDLFAVLTRWEEIRMSKEFKEKIVKRLASKKSAE